ncbi:unnamed protein product [Blepharisma stoltei]|uniref:NAC-A/B domain-containing protein n=1 Tax=Blepharisma stoltei TaxID=1481888 RepID=A0AAU9K4P3_9CILI|nr:unnamed protein product [Blepharisma stoltei]
MPKVEDVPEEQKQETQVTEEKPAEETSHTEEKHEHSHEGHSHEGHSHEGHSHEGHSHEGHSHDHDHDHPHTHGEGHKSDEEGEEGAAGKQSRGEKKCRKAMQKLGLKPVPGINRVTMKRAKNMLFIVENPEVMKSPNADIYVVFGVARFEDLNQMQAAAAAKDFAAEQPKKEEVPVEPIKEDVAGEEEGDLDETGLKAEDITTIMNHCKVSKNKAIKALREANGDTVDAILKLS